MRDKNIDVQVDVGNISIGDFVSIAKSRTRAGHFVRVAFGNAIELYRSVTLKGVDCSI